MKLTDSMFLLKKRLLKRDNILLGIILAFIFMAIFSCITIMNFVSSFKTSMVNSAAGRTLIIDAARTEEDFNKISGLEHIELVDSTKYLNGITLDASQFDKNDIQGEVELLPLLSNDIEIVSGTNVTNEGEIIIPKNFYPYSLYIDEGYDLVMAFFASYMLDGDDLIGDNITLKKDGESVEFKVVGTFENKILNSSSACYISKEDFDDLKSDIEYCSEDICYEYSSLMIRVDDSKNINDVNDELQRLGYISFPYYTFDEGMLATLTYIPLFVGGCVLIISIIIIYSFFKKKIHNNKFLYGVLKSVGYTNGDVKSVAILEGSIINIVSVIIALILYFIGYNIVTDNCLQEFSYSNFFASIPWSYMVLFVICLMIFVMLVINYLTEQSLKSCVQKLFERV